MPNQLLTSIHKEHGIPMAKLEDYWNRAKELAEGKDAKSYWAYVNAIFHNMLKLQSTSADYPSWWKKLSSDEQKEYLKEHPNSKLGAGQDKPDSSDGEDYKPDSDGSDSEDYKSSDSDRHSHIFGPDSEEDNPKHEGGDEGMSAKSLISGAYKRSQEAIHAHLAKNKSEVKAVGKFLTGGALDKEEQDHAINFAKKAGALLVGALVIASFATPLAGHGAELGKYFFDNYWGTSESSDGEKDPVHEFMAKFQDWLAEQDQDKLLDEIKGQSK